MKKFAAAVLAVVICLGMVSCGESDSKDSKETKDTSSAAAESENSKSDDASSADSAEPAETEPAESAAPEADVDSYEVTNDLLGIKCTFDMPKFEGWEPESVEEDGDNTVAKYKYTFDAEDGSSSYCTVRVYLLVDSINGLDWFIKENDPIPFTEYTGYLTGTTKTQNCPMNFYCDDYLDGKVRVDVSVECYSENMPQEKYSELLETIQKSLRTEVSDTNQLYGDDGALHTLDGKFSIPKTVEIAGVNADILFKTYNRTLHAETEFTADGNDVRLHESGLVKSDIFDAFIEKNTKDQAYDCEVNGHPAKGRLWNDFGTLTAEYIVQFDDETFYRFYVESKGSLDLAAINEMMNGSERGELEGQMNGYLSDFVSSMTAL